MKDHEWFKDYQWDKILNKEHIAPFIPNVFSFFFLQLMKRAMRIIIFPPVVAERIVMMITSKKIKLC